MEKLKKHIHDDSNGLDYVLVGDYYIPDLQLPEESRPIGRWGRMHREYLQEYCFCLESCGHILPIWMSRHRTVWIVSLPR